MSLKIHYYGKRNGFSFCGLATTSNLLTGVRSDVTCKLCLRCIGPEPLKRGRPRADAARPLPKSAPLHWRRVASMFGNVSLCGHLDTSVKIADTFDKVTCRGCRRIADIHPEHKRMPVTVQMNVPSDSAISHMFKQTEARLQAALAQGRNALAGWSAAGLEGDYVARNAARTTAGVLMADVLRELLTIHGSLN